MKRSFSSPEVKNENHDNPENKYAKKRFKVLKSSENKETDGHNNDSGRSGAPVKVEKSFASHEPAKNLEIQDDKHLTDDSQKPKCGRDTDDKKSAKIETKPKKGYRIMFEGFDEMMVEYYTEMIRKLGGEVTEDLSKVTHVVMAPAVEVKSLTCRPRRNTPERIRKHARNYRIWSALSTANHFVHDGWIKKSIRKKRFVSTHFKHLAIVQNFKAKYTLAIHEKVSLRFRIFLFSGKTFIFTEESDATDAISIVLKHAGAFVQIYDKDQKLSKGGTYYIVALRSTTTRERQICREYFRRNSGMRIYITNLRRISKAIGGHNTNYL